MFFKFVIFTSIIVLAFIYLVPMIFLSLPKPSGIYQVGVTERKLLLERGEQVGIRIWYPASYNNQKSKRAPYHPSPIKDLKGMFNMPSFVFFFLKWIKTEAAENPPVAKQDATFPVIIYSHGLVSKYIENSALFLELASHGFVVASINHTFTFQKYDINPKEALQPNEAAINKLLEELNHKVLPDQVEEQKMVIKYVNELNNNPTDLLYQQLDTSRYCLMGHSYGGTVSTQTAGHVHNVFAVINMDGPIYAPDSGNIDVPYLYLTSYSPELSDEELKKKGTVPGFYRTLKRNELNSVKSLRINNAEKICIRLYTAGHLDLTDTPFVLPFLTTKGYDKHSGHKIKGELITTFLKQAYQQQAIKLPMDNKLIEKVN